MFLDISGFSAMTDTLMQHGQHGAEVLTELMRAVFDPIVDAIFGQGGMIVGYAGDAVTALFFVERDDLTNSQRVLASAQTIQQGLQDNPSYETPYGTFHVSARMGISLGLVSWGILRSQNGEKAIYYFRGDAVDEAVQAEHQASAGEIIFSKKIYDVLNCDIVADQFASFYRLRQLPKNLLVSQPVHPPLIDSALASVFVPADVIDGKLRGEFRQAVNLFMRIPELSDEQLEDFMYIFFDLQTKYGGLIDRIDFGDKGCNMIVLWGAPVAYENDIGRAMNFIFDLKARVEFPVTAGLTYYISHAGYIGGQLFENYTCYGWGINLAARFMMSAPEGEVWLDERVAQRSKKRFVFEHVGEQHFKGFAEKQSVYILLDRKSKGDAFFQGKMLGRGVELQKLTEFVAPIWAGNYAGVVSVWGEAGMGKSRLLYEFSRSALFDENKALWALCQSDQILRQSFNPLRYWLFRYFNILSGEDEAIRLKRFQSNLEDLISSTGDRELTAEIERTHSFLGALVDLYWNDSLYAQLDAQGRYDNTIIALISLIKAESLRQPLLLFIEDAHYLDEDSKAFLSRLKRALTADVTTYPVAIILTTRWQGTEILLEEGLVDQDIDLGALTYASISQLAVSILDQPADPSLLQLINNRAEGNPFFAEQILRYLQTEGNLELGENGWLIRKELKSSAMPADISKMLVARLDQLTYQVKEVVHAAAVLGREFVVQILSRMLLDDLSLVDEIAAAEKASVWYPLNEMRYIFKHSLMRDVAYNMQLRARRQELHAVALEALEKIYEDELHFHYGELAYHSERAILVEKARHYLTLAGHTARDAYQNLQALDYYERALRVTPGDALENQYDLHRECEKLYTELGKPDELLKEVEILHSLAEQIGEIDRKAEVELFKAQLSVSDGSYENSAERAEHAVELGLKANRYDVCIGAYQTLFDGYYQQGMFADAIKYGELGLEISHTNGASHDEAYLLNRLGLAFLDLKDLATATPYFEQSLNIFRGEDDKRGVARVLANLGLVAGHRGDYTAAIDYCEQALELAREIGSRKGEALVLGNLGWYSGLMGDYRKALSYAKRNLRIAREIGDKFVETYSLINLSSHASALGDSLTSAKYAEEGIELARQSNNRNAEAWALTYYGHGLFDSGNIKEALVSYRNALALREELDQPVLATEPCAGLARIALIQNNRSEARTHLETIMSQLGKDGTLEGTDQPLRVYLNCYLVLHAINDQRANKTLKTGYELLIKRADGITDPSARQMFLEKITYNREILSIWESKNPR
jgi:predicted ATPase/class 3 adenylate cyclase